MDPDVDENAVREEKLRGMDEDELDELEEVYFSTMNARQCNYVTMKIVIIRRVNLQTAEC